MDGYYNNNNYYIHVHTSVCVCVYVHKWQRNNICFLAADAQKVQCFSVVRREEKSDV